MAFLACPLGRRVESIHDYAGVLIPLDEAHLHSRSLPARSIRSPEPSSTRRTHDVEQTPDGETKDDELQSMLQVEQAHYTIDSLRAETRHGGRRTEYEVKSKLINKAIGDMGMGPYTWQLFTLCGFGWLADNLWLQGVSLTLPSLSAEFGISEKAIRYTTSACFVGLSLGSATWGIGADHFGRRIPFNLTLLVASAAGILSAYAQTWAGVCVLFGALGFGVGGSLPVDGALFLEFLPEASSSLLTLLSVWWPVGQLASSLAAWFFIGTFPAGQGWRYFVVSIGLLTFAMFVLRFFTFHLFESPKFLLGKGRQGEAVAVVHGIAYRNGAKTWLTSDILDRVAAGEEEEEEEEEEEGEHGPSRVPGPPPTAKPTPRALLDKISTFSGQRLGPLFKDKTLGTATALIWFSWASIGMGYPLFNAFLPQYFSHSHPGGAEDAETGPPSETAPLSGETYRSYAITSAVGLPGSLLAARLVDSPSPFLGRRGTLAGSTLASAIFLLLFAVFGGTPRAQLAFSCLAAFSQNIMYGVLYAFTPEMFPTPVRGAGTGVASFLNRLTGLMAPVVAANVPGDGATIPVYIAGGLILGAFGGICLIPMETRGGERL